MRSVAQSTLYRKAQTPNDAFSVATPLISCSPVSTIDALICPFIGCHPADRPCRSFTHPYQWQARDVYDRAASGAEAVVYLDMGIDCTESLVPPPIDLTQTPLYRAAIELIQSRHPRGFIVVPDCVCQAKRKPVCRPKRLPPRSACPRR